MLCAHMQKGNLLRQDLIMAFFINWIRNVNWIFKVLDWARLRLSAGEMNLEYVNFEVNLETKRSN